MFRKSQSCIVFVKKNGFVCIASRFHRDLCTWTSKNMFLFVKTFIQQLNQIEHDVNFVWTQFISNLIIMFSYFRFGFFFTIFLLKLYESSDLSFPYLATEYNLEINLFFLFLLMILSVFYFIISHICNLFIWFLFINFWYHLHNLVLE